MTMTAAGTTSPDWADPRLHRFALQRERCQHVLEGLDKLRELAGRYLPKLPRETPSNYAIRVMLAELTNLLAAAVRASEGLMIAEPPTLHDDATPELQAIWQDVDGQQTGGSVWLRGVLRQLLADGWCVAVVSTPVRSGVALTLAQVRAQRLRPYVSLYHANDVRSVRTTKEGGRTVIRQIVLRERVEVETDGYGTTLVTQWRVLRRAAPGAHVAQVFRQDEQGKYVSLGEPETIETQELPVVEFSSLPTGGFGEAPPPLLELADMTIAHWNVKTDRRWSMKQACFPWLVRIGYTADETTTASVNDALDLPQGGDAKWIAPPATAFEPTRDELSDIEKRAAQLSLSFVSGESAQQKTATATKIDQQGQDAGLAAIAVSLRDALNRLGAILSEMLGEEIRDEYFHVQTAFRRVARDPQYLRIMLDAWQAHAIDTEALVHVLKHGTLPEDRDVEALVLDAIAEAEAGSVGAAERSEQTGAVDAETDPMARAA